MEMVGTTYVPAFKPRRMPAWALLAAVLASGGVPWQEARASCGDVARSLQTALAARDLEAARHHYEAVEREFGCDDAFRARAARAVANLHARVAQERMAGGASLRSQRRLLERGVGYARTWSLLAMLGGVAYDARDYEGAAGAYQEALMVINDEARTPEPPPRADVEAIFVRATQSRLLATRFVGVPTNRSGKADGLAAPGYRGFVPERVAVPIRFHTASAELTDLGRRHAEELARMLLEERPERIVLSAHTDERGTEAYNLDLSRRRGEAVRRLLRERGVTQPVEVLARGEGEPFRVADPENHTQEQRWQMDRRVELVR